MRPCRDRLLDQLMKINEYRTSLFPLSYPSGKPGGRVNWGQCRAPKNSATLLHIFSMLDPVESERGGAQTYDRDPRVILSLSIILGLAA